jgi:hypothetical protein
LWEDFKAEDVEILWNKIGVTPNHPFQWDFLQTIQLLGRNSAPVGRWFVYPFCSVGVTNSYQLVQDFLYPWYVSLRSFCFGNPIFWTYMRSYHRDMGVKHPRIDLVIDLVMSLTFDSCHDILVCKDSPPLDVPHF